MDMFDEASAKELREREASIARARAKTARPGGKYCVDCENEINPQRRAAMPSATRCLECQEHRET